MTTAVTVSLLTLAVSPLRAENLLSQQGPGPSPSSSPPSFVTPASKDPRSLHRAMNLARQAAERANGGLDKYRAEPSMQGSASESPYKEDGNNWVFTFLGGPPGAAYTTGSVVSVSKDGSQVNVIYNGPIRTGN